jgi:hypothetical protein
MIFNRKFSLNLGAYFGLYHSFLCVEQMEECIAKRKEKPMEILGQIFLVYLEIPLQSIL